MTLGCHPCAYWISGDIGGGVRTGTLVPVSCRPPPHRWRRSLPRTSGSSSINMRYWYQRCTAVCKALYMFALTYTSGCQKNAAESDRAEAVAIAEALADTKAYVTDKVRLCVHESIHPRGWPPVRGHIGCARTRDRPTNQNQKLSDHFQRQAR